MKVIIKRFDKDLPLPEYKTDGAAAMDLYARQDITIPAGEVVLVPLNVAIQIPKDHWVLVSARSSLHKKGLMVANGIGVGDYDYRGDNDEYQAVLYNFTNQLVKVKRAERLVQLVVLKRERVEFEEKDHLDTASRGGFGSTGD
jgi:dUTP pyrophosphatase